MNIIQYIYTLEVERFKWRSNDA